MRMLSMIVFFLLGSFSSFACEVCKKQQPKILKGITHGAGPRGDWDYVVVWIMVAIVVISFFYAVKWSIRPGEKEARHIKRSILNFE